MRKIIAKNSWLVIISVIIFSLTSCSKGNVINVTMDDGKGLKDDAVVICKGMTVGEVTDVSFCEKKLNVQIKLKKNFQIPKESKLFLISTDILGTKAILILLSDNNEYYTKYDTLKCYDMSNTRLDTILMNIDSSFKIVKDSLPKLLEGK